MQRIKRKFKSFQREDPEPYKSTYSTDYDYVDDFLRKSRMDWASERRPSSTSDIGKINFAQDRKILQKLFPRLNFDDLKSFATSRIDKTFELEEGVDYEVVRRDPTYIYVINDKKLRMAYPESWFKPPFKKYDFEVYAKSTKYSTSLTKDRYYRLIGETNNGYEILDDRGYRSNCSKSYFGFPETK
jgi:hypothetical protein